MKPKPKELKFRLGVFDDMDAKSCFHNYSSDAMTLKEAIRRREQYLDILPDIHTVFIILDEGQFDEAKKGGEGE